jgi:hypothetical protein
MFDGYLSIQTTELEFVGSLRNDELGGNLLNLR